MFVREVLLPLLVSSVSKKLLALDSTLLNEALRQPFVDKRRSWPLVFWETLTA